MQKYHLMGKNDWKGWAERSPPGHKLKMQPSPACMMFIPHWQSMWKELAPRLHFHWKSPCFQLRGVKNSRLSQMNSPTQLLGAYIPAGKSELNCALKFISSFPDAALYLRALRSWGFQTWIEPLALALSPDFQSQSQKEKTENLTASLNLLPPGSWGSRSSAVLSLANKTRSRDEGLSNIF